MKHPRRSLLATGVVAMTLCTCAISVARAEDDDGQLDAGQLGVLWWQLAASIPAGQNPIWDLSGEFCQFGQRSDIWFLHGSSIYPVERIERKCTIPAGKRTFLPIFNSICLPFPGETIQENVRLCRSVVNGVAWM